MKGERSATMHIRTMFLLRVIALLFFCGMAVPVSAQNAAVNPQTRVFNPRDALPAAEWKQVENSVERALAWLASQQLPDGSFASIDAAQPAVTSLCAMAFFARG